MRTEIALNGVFVSDRLLARHAEVELHMQCRGL